MLGMGNFMDFSRKNPVPGKWLSGTQTFTSDIQKGFMAIGHKKPNVWVFDFDPCILRVFHLYNITSLPCEAVWCKSLNNVCDLSIYVYSAFANQNAPGYFNQSWYHLAHLKEKNLSFIALFLDFNASNLNFLHNFNNDKIKQLQKKLY